MKIYFAGSIRGADNQKELYQQIVEELNNYGEVLSEHIAKVQVNLAHNIAATEPEIFAKDVAMIDASDLVVAEVSAASHGVGRELAYAQYAQNKPIICLHKDGQQISAMLKGNPYLQGNIHVYNTIEDIRRILAQTLQTGTH